MRENSDFEELIDRTIFENLVKHDVDVVTLCTDADEQVGEGDSDHTSAEPGVGISHGYTAGRTPEEVRTASIDVADKDLVTARVKVRVHVDYCEADPEDPEDSGEVYDREVSFVYLDADGDEVDPDDGDAVRALVEAAVREALEEEWGEEGPDSPAPANIAEDLEHMLFDALSESMPLRRRPYSPMYAREEMLGPGFWWTVKGLRCAHEMRSVLGENMMKLKRAVEVVRENLDRLEKRKIDLRRAEPSDTVRVLYASAEETARRTYMEMADLARELACLMPMVRMMAELTRIYEREYFRKKREDE